MSTAETTASSANGTAAIDDPHGDEHHDGIAAAVEEQKGKAAERLRDVAHLVRERASEAPLPGIDRAAEAAARPLETGAEYLEQHSPSDMWSDTMEFCRNHPAGTLAIGFVAGYLFKKILR